MCKIIDFYINGGTDNQGRTLDDILGKSNDWMEAAHDYVQWIFPTKEPSGFNPNAPVLTNEELETMRFEISRKGNLFYTFFDVVENFLRFLGIKSIWCFDTFSHFELAEDFHQRRYTWLEFNHNALRITRMFTCLSLMGFGKGIPGTASNMGQELLDFMKSQAAANGARISDNTLSYWEAAVFDYDA